MYLFGAASATGNSDMTRYSVGYSIIALDRCHRYSSIHLVDVKSFVAAVELPNESKVFGYYSELVDSQITSQDTRRWTTVNM